MNPRPRVLLGISGGIAAYKSVELLRRLKDRGFDVRCALSKNAEAFVAPLTLEVLSGHAVYRQEYLTPTGRGEESHIALAHWADGVCFAPATANLIARLAYGLADDFLTTTALAFPGPVVVAPAMHAEMWGHAAVRENVATLDRRGVRFVGPVEGPLADGKVGMGRLADPAEIAGAVEHHLAASAGGPLAGRRVLISAGPTREAIDPVRFICNRSSGKMGFALAAEAARRGAEVVLVAGPVALATPPGVERIDVTTALEMRDAVYERAPASDVVVMTAAVADFRPRSPAREKLKKELGPPRIEFDPNPDILQGLPDIAPDALLVGFAAETDLGEEQIHRKLERKGCHLLVANDVSRSDIGFGADANEVIVYRREGEPVAIGRRPKPALAGELIEIFQNALEERAAHVAPALG